MSIAMAMPKSEAESRKELPASNGATPCCCLECRRPAENAENAESSENAASKRNAKSSRVSELRISSMKASPRSTTVDKCMPKVRNRNQATTTHLSPTMHRKSKSKSKTKTTIGSALISTNAQNSRQNAKNISIYEEHYQQSQHQSQSKSQSATESESESQLQPRSQNITGTTSSPMAVALKNNIINSTRSNSVKKQKKKSNSMRFKMLVPLPTLGATSFVTFLTVICIETVLLSTMSSCAKTFYMHWNTSNSIFRIDNTDHIIDVNKGNLAFEFDQVHIICPVYEPGTYENETEKYIIYNVSKVEYETCRITNADPRVIAICDKPQKLMFFTITFRPFTPQPGGLEFLPGNDYYFISTSSKDDLYRRIGGRCSTNNMKVVFKVCCAAEEKNKTTAETTLLGGSVPAESGIGSVGNGVDNAGVNLDLNPNLNINHGGHHGHNAVNTIGISGVNTGLIIPTGGGGGGMQLKPINGVGTSINSNIDQFNRVPIQPNIIGNNIGAGAGSGTGTGGIMLSPGHGSINMLPPGRGGVHMAYPGHHHIQTGIRINNVPTQQQNNQHQPHHKGNNNVNTNDDHHNYDKHPNEVVKNEELTYNSGSGRTADSHMNGYIWMWMGLSSSVCVYGINSTILIAITVVILFNHLFDSLAANLKANYRPCQETETERLDVDR
ncbi:uncharacterized protein LOC117788155 [Drosophila innubila]|uniref:uncharacterized protein LOC117788155 n=1 Tax=Drosophila innubila TaxID=198719 RepID=UPI00148DB161|nr:uncharacterized protein LOC117788155 [Drosophila innubila]